MGLLDDTFNALSNISFIFHFTLLADCDNQRLRQVNFLQSYPFHFNLQWGAIGEMACSRRLTLNITI
jgi:hypothetical protein